MLVPFMTYVGFSLAVMLACQIFANSVYRQALNQPEKGSFRPLFKVLMVTMAGLVLMLGGGMLLLGEGGLGIILAITMAFAIIYGASAFRFSSSYANIQRGQTPHS